MTKGEDLRVVKSIREIKQAFLRLILKKPMDKIKISDIADEALINRKTFYRHFTVLSDVPKRICSDFTGELETEAADVSDQIETDAARLEQAIEQDLEKDAQNVLDYANSIKSGIMSTLKKFGL